MMLNIAPIHLLQSLMKFWHNQAALMTASEIAQHISRYEHIEMEKAWRVVNQLYAMKVIELAQGSLDLCVLSERGRKCFAQIKGTRQFVL